MSASLVGSEMCIRDSRWAPPGRARARLRSLPAATRAARRRGHRRFHPVSYTHLTLPTICSV
eukprot:6773122-Alexandrium_andersonii.AAC.1